MGYCGVFEIYGFGFFVMCFVFEFKVLIQKMFFGFGGIILDQVVMKKGNDLDCMIFGLMVVGEVVCVFVYGVN